MTAKAILFSSWRSSCSYRVRICLNHKQIPYTIHPVNLMNLSKTGEGFDDREVLVHNPMKYVPALKIDGHTLVESIAIMEYLEETRPELRLLPKDHFKRAQVRAICDIIVAGIQPLQNIGVLNHMGDFLGEKEKKWSQHWITRGFEALEKCLAKSAGKFCVGDEMSFADCCLAPQVFNARRFQIDIEKYPLIFRIDHDLHRQKAVHCAHPFVQDDFPAEMFTDKKFFEAKL